MAIGPSNFICDKVQWALKVWIESQAPDGIPDGQFYKGIQNPTVLSAEVENPTRLLPCVECVCLSAVPVEHDNDGIVWMADAQVKIRSSADDSTENMHHEYVQNVLNVITTDSIAHNLSDALTDFTAFMVNYGAQSWGIEGRTWATQISLQIFCCGSDIDS